MEHDIEYRICPAIAPDGSLLHMLIRIRRQAVDKNGMMLVNKDEIATNADRSVLERAIKHLEGG
jgi:hypothetical protein